jgi:hypothetical protein
MGAAIGRLVMRNPPHIKSFDTQPEVIRVKGAGSSNIRNRKVRYNAGYLHLSS